MDDGAKGSKTSSRMVLGGLVAALVTVGMGCDGDGATCTVTPPEAWSAPDWETNAADALALRTQLTGLTGAAQMRGAETGDATATTSSLNAAYEAGTTSLKSVTTSYFDAKIADSFEEFLAAVEAGQQDLVDDEGNWTPGAEGGIWNGPRAINEGGLEVRQVVDKGLFGGASLYNYALGLTGGTITPATVDAMAAAFGANAGLNPGRSNDEVEANQNVFSANYVYRMGHYGEVKQALIAAKAYAADAACTAERDEAIQSFFRNWEQGLFARYVYYANAALAEMETAVDDDARSGSLHELAEGLGLAIGFYGVEAPATGPMSGVERAMTDARIATALDAMGIDVDGDLGDATTGTFVYDLPAFTSGLDSMESVIAEAYGLSATDLASYRAPTDG